MVKEGLGGLPRPENQESLINAGKAGRFEAIVSPKTDAVPTHRRAGKNAPSQLSSRNPTASRSFLSTATKPRWSRLTKAGPHPK